jgi:hypothetical protein
MNNSFVHGEAFIKNCKKKSNKKESNTHTNEQAHGRTDARRNKRTKKQSHQPLNKNHSNTEYNMYVHKLITHWTDERFGFIDNFLQGWVSTVRRTLRTFLGGFREYNEKGRWL